MSDTSDRESDAAQGMAPDAEPSGLDLGLAPAADTDFGLHDHVEEYDDAPDECTIFPRTASADFPRTTTWVTAKEGSYLSLDDAR
jgi:hypothetical protein